MVACNLVQKPFGPIRRYTGRRFGPLSTAYGLPFAGVERARGRDDLLRAWQALKIIQHVTTLGRPPETNRITEAEFRTAVAKLKRDGWPVTQAEVTQFLGWENEREVRRCLERWNYPSWRQFVAQVK